MQDTVLSGWPCMFYFLPFIRLYISPVFFFFYLIIQTDSLPALNSHTFEKIERLIIFNLVPGISFVI